MLLDRRTLLASFGVSWWSMQRVLASEPIGEVTTARGECYAQIHSQRRELASAANLFLGDAVNTGVQSALTMRLGAATEVKLGAEAQLRIDRFIVNAGGVLVLERGGMLYDHGPNAGASDVTVRGPFGLVAVRGTRFFAGPSNGVFGVFVERGVVMVVGVNTAVVVAEGQGTNLAGPGAEPTLPAPWGAARIASAMASVN